MFYWNDVACLTMSWPCYALYKATTRPQKFDIWRPKLVEGLVTWPEKICLLSWSFQGPIKRTFASFDPVFDNSNNCQLHPWVFSRLNSAYIDPTEFTRECWVDPLKPTLPNCIRWWEVTKATGAIRAVESCPRELEQFTTCGSNAAVRTHQEGRW